MRRVRGPFPALANLPSLAANDAQALIDRVELVRLTLEEAVCNCNGHAVGKQRDEYFHADLTSIVNRTLPNLFDGVLTVVDLSSLRAEVDDNDEVCAWLYDFKLAK